ncbi:probable serine carboxypeptidase CPVL [Dermacentor silvarum]|uniref:probable serine carboxypeptidase CPVL n=1 Tax=Dermacentor silvarum TaxID=543639 RepID=UPI0021010D27|nr:probable serine carboxypeptidase CPVL [Dermacentor silvarum]
MSSKLLQFPFWPATSPVPVMKSSTGSGPLFLTPFIEENNSDEARTISRVKLFKDEANVTAHSGFITVNRTLGSHLFFLYIRAQEHTSTTALMLWTQGGPGLSSLFGQFLEIGPLAINGDGNLYKRLQTIQKHVSVIYLDVPVGAGYSFTKDPSGYAHSLEDISVAVAEFLGQFLILFPEYKERDFYVAGESYGGRYAVGIAYHLLTNKVKPVPLKLQGTIAGVGFLGPIFDIADSSEFLYRASMLTEEGRDTFAKQFQAMRSLFASRKVKEALYLLLQTIFTDNTNPTLFQNLTLYNNQASALYSEKPANMIQYSHYVNTTDFREAIHVGLDAEFEPYSEIFMASLAPDIVTDISGQIELLLNTSQVLFYTGQVDALFPSTNLRAFFRTLHWTGASQYRNSPRRVWNLQDGSNSISGYIVRVHNFTEAIILKAGHYAAVDKPDEAYYLMSNFIDSKSTLA